jgi:hypothetical protein
MTRKGTEGRMPQTNIGANESGIDKAVKKTKEAFGGDNEAVDYKDGKDEQQEAKEYSKNVQSENSGDDPARD